MAININLENGKKKISYKKRYIFFFFNAALMMGTVLLVGMGLETHHVRRDPRVMRQHISHAGFVL